MSLNAEFQYDEITANLNWCGEQGPQGPQGEQGPAGPTDLSNYVQTPINLTSLYDSSSEEPQTSHIQLKTFEYQTNDEYAEVKLEGNNLQLKSVSDSAPARSGLTISAGGLYATALGYPAYENAEMNFQNTGLFLKTYSEDPISYETNQHIYQFEEGFGKVQNYGSGPFRVINLRASNYPPEEKLESWYPQANWPVGMSYLNTAKNDLYFLTDVTTAYDPDYSEDMATLYWQKLPAMKLLWENSDPSTAFDQVTVTLNDSLASYRQICIEAGLRYNGVNYMQSTATVGTDFDSNQGGLSTIVRGSSSMQFYTRDFSKVDSTHIQFQPCRMNKVTKSTGVWATEATNQLALIPFRIYGIK